MAKCVELVKTKSILRVPNEEAQKLVGNGLAIYVPKRLWKATQEKPNND